MSIVITSKGKDFNTWRAAGDFGKMFHEELRKRDAILTSEQSEALILDVGHELERRAADHDASLVRMKHLIAEVAASNDPASLQALMVEYWTVSYELFRLYRSATAFFQLSQELLTAVSGSVVAIAKARLGVATDMLPPVAVVAMGPTGRHEFSPFCSLQLLLIHGEPDPSLTQSLGLLGPILHEVYEEIGLHLDEAVTPRTPDWRGSSAQWRQRIINGLESGESTELIEILRLADQSVLHDEANVGADFRTTCLGFLTVNRSAMDNLVTRLHSLSSGIGLMGGIRTERSGPCRGLFGLLDHALLPLSASITALSFMHALDAPETPMRIRGLLYRGLLNVDMAERLLEAWHLFNELRLGKEVTKHPHWDSWDGLCLDISVLSDAGQNELLQCLETVVTLQRHVGITFSSWQEQ